MYKYQSDEDVRDLLLGKMARFLHIKNAYVSACYERSICDPSQRNIFCFSCGKMGTSGYVLDVDIYTCIS